MIFIKWLKYSDPLMFADDTNLFYFHKNIKTLFQIVTNCELKLVNEWFLADMLSINAKKQSMLYFIKWQCVTLSVATANHDIQ